MGPNVKKESYSAPTIYPDANPRGKLPPTPTPDIQEPQVSRDPSSEPNPSGLESPSREEVR
jgi:hypothetical protein